MNLYSYLDNNKKSLAEAIQFVCEAEDILVADKLAKAAKYDPMKLSMASGIRIVFLFDVKSFKLWREETVKVDAKPDENKPAKYYLNLPGWYYKNEEFVSNIANSKFMAIAQNEAKVKQYMWDSNVSIFWEMPYGQCKIRIHMSSGEIKALVQQLEDWKKFKKNGPNLAMSPGLLDFLAMA